MEFIHKKNQPIINMEQFSRFLDTLKNPQGLKTKPNMKLKPNHFKEPHLPKRWWNSSKLGTAMKDGNGWYKSFQTVLDERSKEQRLRKKNKILKGIDK